MKKIKREIIEFFTKNWLPKLIALVIAILLWLYINYEQLPGKYFSVPLEVRNIPKGMAIAQSYNNTVTVKIKGPGDVIQSINAKYFKASLNLTHAVIGENRFPVEVKLTRNIKRIRIVSSKPEEIKINLDKSILKELPVSVTVINSPAEGFIKTRETFFPKTILIKGPQTIVEKLEMIRTKPIDIGGVTGSIYKEVELDLPSEFIFTYNYKRVNANINIKKNYKVRYLKKIGIVIKDLSDKFKIKNQDDIFVNIKIYGPPERLAKLDKEHNFLFINLSDISERGVYIRKVEYKIPWNCKIRKIDPNEVRIDVEGK